MTYILPSLLLKECIDIMKRTIYYFLVIIIANIFFIRFYFTQELYRMVAFFALLAIAYTIPKFSNSIAHLFTVRDFPERKTHSNDSNGIIKSNKHTIFIAALILPVLVGLHVVGYWIYFKNENNDLSNKGIYAPAIITDKKLETRPDHLSGYYIYYFYKYNGMIYKHSSMNDTLEKGDTIVVKFSPENPDHHIITDKVF